MKFQPARVGGRSVISFWGLVLSAIAMLCAGCTPSGASSEEPASAELVQALEASELPFLKYLFNEPRSGEPTRLYLRQAHVPTMPVLRGAFSQTLHQVQQTDDDGEVIGEIHSEFPGICSGNQCQNAVQYGGASGVHHLDSDWLVWASGTQIFAKELRAFGAVSPTRLVHTANTPVTSVPVVATHEGELVVVWTQNLRLMVTRSTSGESWSSAAPLESAAGDYGTHLALTPFQGELYVAYVSGSNQIRLRRVSVATAELGPIVEVHTTSGEIVGRAVSMAAYLDQYLSIAFAHQDNTSPYVEVIHTESVTTGTWEGPFEISRVRQVRRPALAYAVAETGEGVPELAGPNLYLVSQPDGPERTTVTYVQPVPQLLSDYTGLSYRLDDGGRSGRGLGTLFSSTYAFGGGSDNTLTISMNQTEPCSRTIELSWAWSIQVPGDLVRHDLLQNGLALQAGDHPAFRSHAPLNSTGVELEVVPSTDHVIQLVGVRSDGSRVLSNELTYRFTPCGAREVNVAVVRSRLNGGASTAVSVAEIEQMAFAETDSVRSYLAEVSGGTVIINGSVIDRDSVPVPVPADCGAAVNGVFSACTNSRALHAAVVAANPVGDDVDLRIDIVGGFDAVSAAGSFSGDRILLDGWMTYADTATSMLHEVGHYLGLSHDGIWSCPGDVDVGESIFNLDAGDCQIYDYGGFEVMGSWVSTERALPWPWPTPFAVLHGQVIGYLAPERTLYVTQSGEFELTTVDGASPTDLLELRIPFGDGFNTFYSFEYHPQSARLPSTSAVVARVHGGGLLGQSDTVELATVSLVLPTQPLVDPYRGITAELVEFRPPNRALVRLTINPPGSEAASGVVVAGASVTTDGEGDGAIPSDPLETRVTTPIAGSVGIEEGPFTGDPSGFAVFGQQVAIDAPIASSQSPLQLEFRIDQAILPEGSGPASPPLVTVLRDGTVVEACETPSSPAAAPNPCVVSREYEGDDWVIKVLTSRASTWTFAIAEQPEDPCVLAEGSLRIRDRSEVYSDRLHAGGYFELGADFAIASGQIDVAGNARLRPNAVIDGSLTASGNVTIDGPLTLTGQIRQQTPVTPVPIALQTVSPGTSDLILNSDRLAVWTPGRYRTGLVRTRSVVKLRPGTYHFERLELEPDTQLVLEAPFGDALIYVRSSLKIGDRARVLEAGDGQFSFYTNATGTVTLGSDVIFQASVQAPAGLVQVFSRTRVDGCLAAQNITLEPDVIVVQEGRSVTGVPEPNCDDGLRNGDETGVDCGGTCPAICAPPSCTGGATYEAETMFHSTGGSVPGGWNIWSNGYISTNHTFASGPASLTVTARGQSAVGVWPRMVVSVGGVVVGTTNVTSSSWAPYTFQFTSAAGTRQVRVAFDNDYSSGSADRNLLVDKVAVACQ